MAAEKIPPVAFLPGEDPEILAANTAYQDALKKLTASLDMRKNRYFDPVLLAASKGFLAPGTPDFFESLGRVAGNVSEAQNAQIKEEQDIAAQELAVAGQRIELQRLKARDAELARFLGGNQPAAEAPAGGLSQAGQTSEGGIGTFGVQIAPADRSLMTGRQYIALNRFDKSKSPADLMREAAEIDRKNLETKEGGVFERSSGMWYPTPSGKTEPVQIYGKTYNVNANTAAMLERLARNNPAEYHKLAESIISGPPLPGAATPRASGKVQISLYGHPGTYEVDQATADRLSQLASKGDQAYHELAKSIVDASKTQAAQPAPARRTAMLSEEEKKASERQTEIEQTEAKERAQVLGKAAGEKEASLEQEDKNARRIFGSTTRILDLLKQSPNFVGIFARPGVVAAIGNLIDNAIRTSSGTLEMKGFQDSMRSLMPGATQKDLDNVQNIASEIAEIELNFSRMYFQGQGAVTEGERKIVRAIPGSISNSPEVLKTRANLLKARSQFDIDVVDAFRQWRDKNPGKSYFTFERESELYKEIKKNFEQETERLFGGIRAMPTRERTAATPAPAGAPAGAPTGAAARAPAQNASPARRTLDELLTPKRP
jgi:hypothetical protein